MTIHKLKIAPEYYEAVLDDRNKSEVRLNDRDFQAGDELILESYADGVYLSVPPIHVIVTHILTHNDFPVGIQPGYAVLSFDRTIPDKLEKGLNTAHNQAETLLRNETGGCRCSDDFTLRKLIDPNCWWHDIENILPDVVETTWNEAVTCILRNARNFAPR